MCRMLEKWKPQVKLNGRNQNISGALELNRMLSSSVGHVVGTSDSASHTSRSRAPKVPSPPSSVSNAEVEVEVNGSVLDTETWLGAGTETEAGKGTGLGSPSPLVRMLTPSSIRSVEGRVSHEDPGVDFVVMMDTSSLMLICVICSSFFALMLCSSFSSVTAEIVVCVDFTSSIFISGSVSGVVQELVVDDTNWPCSFSCCCFLRMAAS